MYLMNGINNTNNNIKNEMDIESVETFQVFKFVILLIFLLKEQNINILDASEFIRSKTNKDEHQQHSVKEIKPEKIPKLKQSLKEKFGWIEGFF